MCKKQVVGKEVVYSSGSMCCSTLGLHRSLNTTTDRFQTQHQLSQQLKCNKLTLLASEQNGQEGTIHPAAEDLIKMQGAAFETVPFIPTDGI